MMLNKVSLNTIGLNRIGLNRIGKPSRGSSDRPYIDPEVLASLKAVCICYGKSNDDPDRAIVKNLVDPDNPFVISNAAFKLNSGFGKYSFDFERWGLTKPTTICIKKNDSFNITYVSNPVNEGLCIVESSNTSDSSIDLSFKVEITGLEDDMKAAFVTADMQRVLLTNGINVVNIAIKSKKWYGFNFIRNDGTALGNCNIVVRQIPEFQGAFVTDGIDDLITSTKTVQEMGITEACTVISMIHHIDVPSDASFNNVRNSTAVSGRNGVYASGTTGIYGWSKEKVSGASTTLINNILGDKNNYTNGGGGSAQVGNMKFSVQGFISDSGVISETSSVAWYWTIIANKVLTTDQINQVIAYFNLDRTLKPDILCNVKKQGITNENHAEFGDKLIDFSGNGRDIQLNNIAWKGDSGIGKYEVDFLDSSIWNSSNSTITSSKIDCKNAISHIMLLYYSVGSKEYPDIPSFKVIKTGADIDYSYIDETGSPKSVKIVDGANVLPASHNTLYSGSGRFCGFGNPGMGNSVTITQIPSHAGALYLDGVNDFGKVTGMPVYKDYTVVTDREIFANIGAISSKNNPGAFVETVGNSVYSFGQATSGLKFISTRSISYLSKYSYCGQSITAGAAEDGTDMWLGTIRDNDSRFFNGAIYSLMSFPYSMSEFLIERQLKKYKLGSLYPNMVEFRPVIKSSVELASKPTFAIRGTSTLLNAGDYIPENSEIWVVITMNNAADRITKFVINGNTIDIPSSAYNPSTMKYGFPFTINSKSPQKITMTIEQDENYVQWNPVVTSNVEYTRLDFYLNDYVQLINIGDYIPKDAYLRANLYLKNNVDELTVFTFNGVNIDYKRSVVDDTAFNIGAIYNYDSPQEVNITIDEYIRYEDIKQPYPVIFQIKDRNTSKIYNWGDKIKVGSSIQLIQGENPNLLSGLYSIQNYVYEGETYTYNQLKELIITITKSGIQLSCNKTWVFDNNEPKCILSPRLLRIPNSSYKILGYIPDISGHGNHGKINNSAYAEGSGVNEDGSYQFDGVDDFVTIPTVNGGKQVFMKVNVMTTIDKILYDQRNSEEGGHLSDFFAIMISNSDSILAYAGRNPDGKTYIDGILNTNIICGQLLNITHNITALVGDNKPLGKGGVIIGASKKTTSYCKAAVYDFMLFDEISTDDKIQELNEYVGVEAKVELPPYYWDAYGKTNLDEDKATIQQRGVAVGDYDLTNTNFAYDKMSGFGGYTLGKFTNSWSLSNNNNSISVVAPNPYDITLKKLGENSDWEFNNTELKIISNPVSVKFKSDKNIRFTCDYHYYTVGGNSEGAPLGITSKDLIANEDTIITISPISQENIDKYNIDINRGYYLIYFQLSPTLEVNEEVTIEMLPLYPNGLVYDGITDYSENANIPALTDFTVIAKRVWMNKDNPMNECFIHKGVVSTPISESAFMLEYEIANDTYYRSSSYGGYINIERSNRPERIVHQTSNSYNGTSITKGSGTDTTGIVIGGVTNNYWNGVFYKLMLYSKTLPLLQINYLKNLMEKDEIIDLNNPIFIQE